MNNYGYRTNSYKRYKIVIINSTRAALFLFLGEAIWDWMMNKRLIWTTKVK